MPVLALCVGDLPVLNDCSDALRDSCVLMEVRLERDASAWSWF